MARQHFKAKLAPRYFQLGNFHEFKPCTKRSVGVENWSSYLACYQVFVTAGSLPPCLLPGLTGHGETRACCVPSLALTGGHACELSRPRYRTFSPANLLNGSHPTVPVCEPQRWGCHSTLKRRFLAAGAGITHDTQESPGVPGPRAESQVAVPAGTAVLAGGVGLTSRPGKKRFY